MFSVVRLFSLFLTFFFGSKSLLVVYPQVRRAGVKPHFWKEQCLRILFGILLKERFQCLSLLFIFNFLRWIFFFCFAGSSLQCTGFSSCGGGSVAHGMWALSFSTRGWIQGVIMAWWCQRSLWWWSCCAFWPWRWIHKYTCDENI